MDYLDVQISLDGIDAETNDAVRGAGSYAAARRAMDHLADAGFGPFKVSVVVTRHNVDAARRLQGAGRLLRRPAARHAAAPVGPRRRLVGIDCTRPHDQQRRDLPLAARPRDDVLTGDSFFHLNALGESLPGLNMCGAGRVVCLIDPVGDVYACPFVIHDEFRGRLGAWTPAGSPRCGGTASCSASCASRTSAGACASCGSYDACQGGCMAAKFFTGLPLDGPDPECVNGHGEQALASAVGGDPRRGRRRPLPPRDVPAALTGPAVWVALTPSAYLLGTFPSASLVASASGVDITATGSGNPGASNVTRALGWRKGVLVFALDALKGRARHARRAVARADDPAATCSARRRSSGTSTR